MSTELYCEFGVTTPMYHEYYSRSNSSYSPYTAVFPDISDWNFEDSEIESEDSEVSSVFDEDDLATKVKILESKLDLIFLQRNHEREEMLRHHQAMIRLVTDVVKVMSPPTLPLHSPASPLKPEAAAEPLILSTRKEPVQLTAKEDCGYTHWYEDTERKLKQ